MNSYLSKIRASDTDRCECGAVESIPHFLYVCPKWRQQRRAIREVHRDGLGDLSFSLGGYSTFVRNGKQVDGDINCWKPNVGAVKATIAFARATARLDYPPLEATASQPSQPAIE